MRKVKLGCSSDCSPRERGLGPEAHRQQKSEILVVVLTKKS